MLGLATCIQGFTHCHSLFLPASGVSFFLHLRVFFSCRPPFFVLSLKAGGTGLNLTAASHVIHFDRWWNPAVENQATDRAFRIGQRKNVLVHKFVCRGTIEDKIDELIESKKTLSRGVLDGGSEKTLTEMNNDDLLRLVSLDLNRALEEI